MKSRVERVGEVLAHIVFKQSPRKSFHEEKFILPVTVTYAEFNSLVERLKAGFPRVVFEDKIYFFLNRSEPRLELTQDNFEHYLRLRIERLEVIHCAERIPLEFFIYGTGEVRLRKSMTCRPLIEESEPCLANAGLWEADEALQTEYTELRAFELLSAEEEGDEIVLRLRVTRETYDELISGGTPQQPRPIYVARRKNKMSIEEFRKLMDIP